jgi:hypothetical protein
MGADVWLGALISIPVSFAVALTVPHIQRWMDRRGQTSHAKKLSRIRDEYTEVLFYALHTDMLIGKLVVAGLSLLVLLFFFHITELSGQVLGEVASTIWPPPISDAHRAQILVSAVSVLISIGITLLVSISRYISKHVSLFFHVNLFQAYLESIPAEIRDLKMEEIVIAAAKDRAVPGLDYLRSDWLKSHQSDTPGEVPSNQIESAPDDV